MKRYLTVLFMLACMCACTSAESILLARGDSLEHGIGTDPVSIWIFSNNELDHIYDISATQNTEGQYFIILTPEQSDSLQPGKYTILLQNNGINTLKEAKYATTTDAWNVTHEYLVSPYKSVKDIQIDGLQPNQVRTKLIEMITASGTSDDKYSELGMEIQAPYTVINSVEQYNDTAVHIAGTTNLKSGSDITIIWNEDQLVSAQDKRLNTFTTSAYAAADSDIRTWGRNITADIQSLSPGKHWVAVEAGGLTTRVAITIYSTFNSTEIHLEPIKYLNSGVIVTPTPQIIEKEVIREVTVIQTVITIITTQPFPHNALDEEYNPVTVPDVSVIIVPAFALLGAIMVLKVGSGHWRQEEKKPVKIIPDTQKPDLTKTLQPLAKKGKIATFIDRTFWKEVPVQKSELQKIEPKPESKPDAKEEITDVYYGQL